MDIVSTQCGELYFCQVSSIFGRYQKECLCSYPCIKSTLTENMRPFDSFSIRQGQGNDSIWYETFGITRPLLVVSTLVHFTFRVNDKYIEIEADKEW